MIRSDVKKHADLSIQVHSKTTQQQQTVILVIIVGLWEINCRGKHIVMQAAWRLRLTTIVKVFPVKEHELDRGLDQSELIPIMLKEYGSRNDDLRSWVMDRHWWPYVLAGGRRRCREPGQA